MPATATREDIGQRFSRRVQAERYRDRFKHGRRRRTHQREVQAVEAALAALPPLESILDVGSGAGRFVPVFAARAGRVLQADFSQHMLAVSREAQPLPPARSGYVQSDVRRLPLADASVDLVFCHRLLNHLPDAAERARAVRELARVSRQYVLVSCLMAPPVLYQLHRLYQRLRSRERDNVDLSELLADAQSAGLRMLNRSPIRSLLRSSAFFTFAKD